MPLTSKPLSKLHLTLLACALSPVAGMAQTAGTWQWQGGLTQVRPHVRSDALTPPAPAGTTVNVGGDTQPTMQLTYAYTDHLALAVPLGLGFKHKIYGNGAIAGVGQIGSVSALPVSVFAQYRWGEANERMRPYAKLGASYVHFHGAAGSATLNALNPINPVGGSTGLKVDSKLAWGSGLGVVMKLDSTWFVDLSYTKTFLKTTTTLSTGQSVQTSLDPGATSIGFGRNF
jgi:outer membrane protein